MPIRRPCDNVFKGLYDPLLLQQFNLNPQYVTSTDSEYWYHPSNPLVKAYIHTLCSTKTPDEISDIIYTLLLYFKYSKTDNMKSIHDKIKRQRTYQLAKQNITAHFKQLFVHCDFPSLIQCITALMEPNFTNKEIRQTLRTFTKRMKHYATFTSAAINLQSDTHIEHINCNINRIFNNELCDIPLNESLDTEFKSSLIIRSMLAHVKEKTEGRNPISKMVHEILALANSRRIGNKKQLIIGIQDKKDELGNMVFESITYADLQDINNIDLIHRIISSGLQHTWIYHAMQHRFICQAPVFWNIKPSFTIQDGIRYNIWVIDILLYDEYVYPYVYAMKSHKGWYSRDCASIVFNEYETPTHHTSCAHIWTIGISIVSTMICTFALIYKIFV